MLGLNKAILFKDTHKRIEYIVADTKGSLDAIWVSIHQLEDPGFACEDGCMVGDPFRGRHEDKIVVIHHLNDYN